MGPEHAYLEELVARLESLLGEALVGIYVGGSYALGDYERGRSDLDVAAVVARALSPAAKKEVVRGLRHEALPSPARGLELVVYRTGAEVFELNLNSGRDLPFRADLAPVEDERHWFVIDRSVLVRHGLTLRGPPPEEVFVEPGRAELLPALAETLRWFAERDAGSASAVLNACRALHFAREDLWTSKGDAGTWALSNVPERNLVAEALAARRDRIRLDEHRARAFLLDASEQLMAA